VTKENSSRNDSPKMKTPRTTAVVPIISKHLKHVTNILADLSSQTILNDEVILVASGFNYFQFKRLTWLASKYKSLNIRFLKTSLGPAGRNRNVGSDHAQGDLIMFLDVDDRYFPERNRIILDTYEKEGFDALVHLAEHSSNPDCDYKSCSSTRKSSGNPVIQIISTPELFHSTFPGGYRDRIAETLGRRPTNLILKRPNDSNPIHHAHVTVKKSILKTCHFHEQFYPRNEDTLFLRDLLFDGGKVLVLLQRLSIFSTQTSAVHWRAKISWLAKTLKLNKD